MVICNCLHVQNVGLGTVPFDTGLDLTQVAHCQLHTTKYKFYEAFN